MMDEHTQLAMALSISMIGEKEQGSTAIEVPIKDPAVKPKKKRGRKKKKTDEDPDEQTRIAMAISASLADETKQKNKDLGKNEERPGKKTRAKAKKKLKKIHAEFPVLLTRLDDERQKILEGRISALLEPKHSEDIIFSDHVFQRSNIRTKYSDPDSRPLTETYPGNIRIKSGLQLWNATGADLSWKQTGRSPFYVEQLQPTIVPLTPKSHTSPISHQVFSKTPTETPSKQSPKAAVLSNEGSVEESFSTTQSLGMTVQCLAELAEEGLQDSTSLSLSSDKCGFIPQETAHRADSPENRLSDDQLTLLEDLSSLVNSPTMSDAVIQIDDGSKLHVHSFMIQLRCPALATLLAKPFGRKSTGLPSIVVSDMGYEAMENVLSYIYSATVNISNDTAVETHKFAERFEMADLASHCKPYLQDDTDSKIRRKGSELDIVDKDLNQLIDSLWEDEEDDKEEKNRDAGRTSDDDVNDALDDDEIKEIYESSQRFRTIMLEDEELEDDSPFREFVHSSVSSPKNIENDGERMMDEEEEEEEELHKMMLTQGHRRSNTSSYCSRDNSNSDNEDWSMAIDDEVVVQGEVNAQCVTPLAKRTTDERKDMIGENLNECTEDIVDETPKETYNSRRRVSVSSSSTNETITDEHHHISFLNQTLVRESNVSAISMTDRQKKRKASPETSNISKGGSMGLECGDGVKVLHKRFLDAGVEHSESPDDEVLFLRMDSAESESDGRNRTLEKSLQSVRETSLQVENSTGLNGKVQDRGFEDTDQGRLSSSRKKNC
ncbi:structure-specific endonuclease subunit SLX4 [Strongylocentrotus purpuratus]|uniref:Structure-specific endonuclease subunit SLX4 n=1 Tax=Strongylocentrotus purpuratus TaxID=7668 RepID=A0A7M7NGZ0_STRPU|nr:structure-specific endonuclease subunit SLX4 [Strongylocentrotus purpuratus]